MTERPVTRESSVAPPSAQRRTFRPFGLLAELTYRCPLHCPYCSNPVQVRRTAPELSTAEWVRVIGEARELGVLHILFSGGEPLLRSDLPELIAAARAGGLYTNLITAGLGLTQRRVQRLKEAGLDSVQISLQADEAGLADQIAGLAGAHRRKLEAARLVREQGLALTLNVVLHRGNIERLPAIIALAEALGAGRLELASTQYLGWAFLNKEALLPTRTQVRQAEQIASAAQERLRGRMEVLYILPDYYGERPKPCLYGWGRRYISITPTGDVLPCQTAGLIPDLVFENVRERPLSWIWHESAAFNRFRGTQWMPEPCRSCPRREIDFGGCRCQAFLLTGDAAQTDPACSLSPYRERLLSIVERVQQRHQERHSPAASPFGAPFCFRQNPRGPRAE
jgi:pyrroloquinoline quinone biosynthesis protein E